MVQFKNMSFKGGGKETDYFSRLVEVSSLSFFFLFSFLNTHYKARTYYLDEHFFLCSVSMQSNENRPMAVVLYDEPRHEGDIDLFI